MPAQFACDFPLLIQSAARCLALWFAAEKFDWSKTKVPRAEAVNSFDSSLSGIVRVAVGWDHGSPRAAASDARCSRGWFASWSTQDCELTG